MRKREKKKIASSFRRCFRRALPRELLRWSDYVSATYTTSDRIKNRNDKKDKSRERSTCIFPKAAPEIVQRRILFLQNGYGRVLRARSCNNNSNNNAAASSGKRIWICIRYICCLVTPGVPGELGKGCRNNSISGLGSFFATCRQSPERKANFQAVRDTGEFYQDSCQPQ